MGALTLDDRSRDIRAVDEFLRLQNAGWKGDAGVDGKAFERTGLDGWFRAVCTVFQERGKLTVLTMRAGDDIVFMTVTLHSGNRAFGFHDAYASEFRSFSPGALGRLAEMRAVLSLPGVEFFDPSMDDTKYPQVVGLYPDIEEYASYVIPTGQRGALALHAERALHEGRKRVRQL